MKTKRTHKRFLEDSDAKARMIDFLAFFKRICKISSDKELCYKYPQLKAFIINLIGKRNLITKTNEELKTYDFQKMSPPSIVYSVKNTKTLCFLRHLRNSIAHWNLNYQDGKSDIIVIKDFKSANNKTLTCYGLIQEDVLRQIIYEISKHYN